MWKRAEAASSLVVQRKPQPSAHRVVRCACIRSPLNLSCQDDPGWRGMMQKPAVPGPHAVLVKGLSSPQVPNKQATAPGPSVSCSTGRSAVSRAPLRRRPLEQRTRRLPDSACRCLLCSRQARCCNTSMRRDWVWAILCTVCGIPWQARYGSYGCYAERRNQPSSSPWKRLAAEIRSKL